MATYTKKLLSGSANGRCITVAATSTPGTLIHTAVAGESYLDEIFIDALNVYGADIKLTVEFGGVDPGDLIEFTVPAEDGPYRIIPGWPLQNGLEVRAFAATGGSILINGYVNGIT